ncbi:MAG: transporter substrate-binding protein [Clostridiales bacterium]|nr:transporter substrate-binding protein [Clostridiales bacterium]
MKNLLNKIHIIFLICVLTILFSGCSTGSTAADKSRPATTEANDKKPAVAVSIVPQATFVKAVAGDLVDVVTMIPPGNSPTNYAPSPRELTQLSEASLYFSIGVPTEKANILPKLADFNKNLKVVDLARHVAEVYPERYFDSAEEQDEPADDHHREQVEDHHHSGRDPHIWLSPKRVQVMVQVIADRLSEIDPGNKDTYQKNAQSYQELLSQVDRKIKTVLSGVTNKTFLVYHPVFGYFADDYGLKMVAIEKHGKEATIEHMQEVIDLAKQKNIKVIFYQAEIDSKQAQTIAEEIGGKTLQVAPLAPNYIDNLEKIAELFSNVLN